MTELSETCDVTVAICTRNRAALLTRVLESFGEQEVPAHLVWELLVVDNGSTDDTVAAAQAFVGRLPLRVVTEPEPGLSVARNRAVLEARGAYLLWIDDDALPHPGWITAYLAAFAAWPDAAAFGGPIDVLFDGELPEWFRRVLPVIGGVYGECNLGSQPAALQPNVSALPFGTNYAIRTAEQRRFPYDTSLGRHPEHPVRRAEETEVLLAMLESGLAGRWVPDARVSHLKQASDATVAFISTQITEYGAYHALRFPPAGLRVAGAPLSLWWAWLGSAVRYRWGRIFWPPERWIHALLDASKARGALSTLWHQR